NNPTIASFAPPTACGVVGRGLQLQHHSTTAPSNSCTTNYLTASKQTTAAHQHHQLHHHPLTPLQKFRQVVRRVMWRRRVLLSLDAGTATTRTCKQLHAKSMSRFF
ncbi:unnamed protein product, partial [Amoebophrya sp. A120]